MNDSNEVAQVVLRERLDQFRSEHDTKQRELVRRGE